MLWVATRGYLDDVPLDEVKRFESDFMKLARTTGKPVLAEIVQKKILDKDLEEKLKGLITEFKAGWGK